MSRPLPLALLGLVILAGCLEDSESTRLSSEITSTLTPLPSSTPAELSDSVGEPQAGYPEPIAADVPCVQTSHGCISLNPDVTEATLGQTICVTGYTQTVRPSTTYTNGVKAKLVRQADLNPSSMAGYELDHIIPLAVGGHPRKLSNLVLQPWTGENSATIKDGLERRLQRMVCRRQIALADAQNCIAENWQVCNAKLSGGQPLSTGQVIVAATRRAQQIEVPSQSCDIKGNINDKGERVYHLPGTGGYKQTKINTTTGERWFCSEQVAVEAGWRAARR